MYEESVPGITYAVLNTDSQQLVASPVPVKLQLGSSGLGAGGKPEVARQAAEESAEEIRQLFSDGTKMVFVTACMGGGTGTGAAPVVARIARELGILTIGIVTTPFSFEMQRKERQALRGLEQVRREVDALLIIQNDKLTIFHNTGRTTIKQSFAQADNILAEAAKSISRLITNHTDGDINLDFCDVESTLRGGGKAIMATGRAKGENRVSEAIMNALTSPLLYSNDIAHANRLLVDIYTSDEAPLFTDELSHIKDFMDKVHPDVEFIWGTSTDNTLGEDVLIIILAAGFDDDLTTPLPSDEEQQEREIDELMRQIYPNPLIPQPKARKAGTQTVLEFPADTQQGEEASTQSSTSAALNTAPAKTKPSFLASVKAFLSDMVNENAYDI